MPCRIPQRGTCGFLGEGLHPDLWVALPQDRRDPASGWLHQRVDGHEASGGRPGLTRALSRLGGSPGGPATPGRSPAPASWLPPAGQRRSGAHCAGRSSFRIGVAKAWRVAAVAQPGGDAPSPQARRPHPLLHPRLPRLPAPARTRRAVARRPGPGRRHRIARGLQDAPPHVECAIAQVATWCGRRLKLRYRRQTVNHAWLKRRTAAVNLRNPSAAA